LVVLFSAGPLGFAAPASAEPAKPAKEEDGKYLDAEGTPTYNIGPDGKADWYTYSGYRRYHSECHVCHGPDGAGSSYAPALADTMKNMKHEDFTQIVVQGRQNVNTGSQNVMPSFGLNKNVMCYLDDIYVYLRARADGALGRVRPDKHDDKPKSAKEAEQTCVGS
jgi:methanol metabolism-related c-type cytochrome